MGMPRPRPPHLQRERTRHGVMVWYVRVGKGPRIRLKAVYGTPEFTAEYQAAIAGERLPTKKGTTVGSLAWLVARYRDSSAWSNLSAATRKQRDNIFKHALETAGNESYTDITRKVIVAGRERRKATPAAANNFIKTMRGLFKWAVDAEHVEKNPTDDVEWMPRSADGFHAWTEDEVSRFEEKWALGTRERLAFDVLLYTGLRRGDAVRLGRQHIRNGVVTLKTEKTGMPVVIPVLPELAASIAASKTGDLAFIVGEGGNPMTKESFGNWFREVCRQAGVPGTAHGLRKAGAARAASNGATVAQLEAIFGWTGGGMASLYTRSADRERLAREAMTKLAREQTASSIPAPINPGAGRTPKTKGKSSD